MPTCDSTGFLAANEEERCVRAPEPQSVAELARLNTEMADKLLAAILDLTGFVAGEANKLPCKDSVGEPQCLRDEVTKTNNILCLGLERAMLLRGFLGVDMTR